MVIPRMKNDMVEVCEACIDGTLDQINLEFEDNAAVCVVLASDGYRYLMKRDSRLKDWKTSRAKKVIMYSMRVQP